MKSPEMMELGVNLEQGTENPENILDLDVLAENGIEVLGGQSESDDQYLQNLERELAVEGWQFVQVESETQKVMNDQSKFEEEPNQDVETIISKHTYGGLKEVKLVPVPPPTRENLEHSSFSQDEIAEIQATPQNKSYYVFVRDLDKPEDVEARETTFT
jgi:hypothetical protein